MSFTVGWQWRSLNPAIRGDQADASVTITIDRATGPGTYAPVAALTLETERDGSLQRWVRWWRGAALLSETQMVPYFTLPGSELQPGDGFYWPGHATMGSAKFFEFTWWEVAIAVAQSGADAVWDAQIDIHNDTTSEVDTKIQQFTYSGITLPAAGRVRVSGAMPHYLDGDHFHNGAGLVNWAVTVPWSSVVASYAQTPVGPDSYPLQAIVAPEFATVDEAFYIPGQAIQPAWTGEIAGVLPPRGDNVRRMACGRELLCRYAAAEGGYRARRWVRPGPGVFADPLAVGDVGASPVAVLGAVVDGRHVVRDVPGGAVVSDDLGGTYADVAADEADERVAAWRTADDLLAVEPLGDDGALLAAREDGGRALVVRQDDTEVDAGAASDPPELGLVRLPDGRVGVLDVTAARVRVYLRGPDGGPDGAATVDVTLTGLAGAMYHQVWVGSAGQLGIVVYDPVAGLVRVVAVDVGLGTAAGPYLDVAVADPAQPYICELPDGSWEVGWLVGETWTRYGAPGIAGVWSEL